MRYDPEEISRLIAKQLEGENFSPDEERQLQAWTRQSPANQRIYESWIDDEKMLAKIAEYLSFDEEASLRDIISRLENPSGQWGQQKASTRPFLMAAAILLCLIGGWFFYRYLYHTPHTVPDYTLTRNEVFLSGKPATVLSFADGSSLVLDSLRPGPVKNKAGITIDMPSIGKLVYRDSLRDPTKQSFNRLDNSYIKQCQVTLPDGSEVWLNAASSLRYPTIFSGKERIVELTGQAYFKIAPDPAHPFKVRLVDSTQGGGALQIEVLGTSFDCSNYQRQEFPQTILIEGAIKLSKGGAGVILKPRQKASFNPANNKIRVDSIESYSDWRDSNFVFSKTHFVDVLEQFHNWYNIDFICTDKIILGRGVTADFHKSDKIEFILNIFRDGLPGMQYKINGKQIRIWRSSEK